jgi:hypothetical protein
MIELGGSSKRSGKKSGKKSRQGPPNQGPRLWIVAFTVDFAEFRLNLVVILALRYIGNKKCLWWVESILAAGI